MTLTTLLTQLEQGKISAEVAEKHVRDMFYSLKDKCREIADKHEAITASNRISELDINQFIS